MPHAGYRFYLQDDLADKQGAYGAHGGDLTLQFAGLHAQTQQNTPNGGSESSPPSDIEVDFAVAQSEKLPRRMQGEMRLYRIQVPVTQSLSLDASESSASDCRK